MTEQIADTIVDSSIEAEQAEGKQSVGRFVDGVQDRVEEQTDYLREEYGDAARDIVGDVTEEVQSYRQAQLRILDPNANVDDTASQGAAAWNDKGAGNEVVYDHAAMEREKDDAYWKRVRLHEGVHQDEHAAEFNAPTVTFKKKTLAVKPVLVEWGAIRGARQPDSDLTPEYVRHAQEGDELAAYVGAEALKEALRSGDIQRLQELILAREIRDGLFEKHEMSVAA